MQPQRPSVGAAVGAARGLAERCRARARRRRAATGGEDDRRDADEGCDFPIDHAVILLLREPVRRSNSVDPRARLPPSSSPACRPHSRSSGRARSGTAAMSALTRSPARGSRRGPTQAAGSASSGSKASSAAPRSGRVHAERGRDDPDERARRRQRPAVELRLEGAAIARDGSGRSSPPRTTSRGLRTLTSPARPMPEPAARRRRGRPARRATPSAASRRTASTSARPPAVGRARRGEQGALADLGLPAADRAAAAGGPGRVDRDVADLAAVARRARSSGRPSTMSPPPTPTSPEMYSTSSRPAAAPRRCSASDAEVGLVGDRDRDADAPSARARRSPERDVAPAEVRGHRDDSRRCAGRRRRPRRRRRSAGRRTAGRRGRSRPAPARSATMSLDRRVAARPIDADELEDLAAEPDDRGRQRVDRDLEGEDDGRRRGSGGPAATAARASRAARPAPRSTRPAATSSPIRPRIALRVSPVADDELRPRQRAALVQLADDGAQVRPADGLAALPDLVAADRHGFVFLSSKPVRYS